MRSPRVEILDLISDDSYGLWEVVGWLQRNLPDHAEAQSIAASELVAMHEEDLVEILHQVSFDSAERVMERGEVLDRLGVDRYWQVPEPGTDTVRAAATDSGIEYYNAHWQERGA